MITILRRTLLLLTALLAAGTVSAGAQPVPPCNPASIPTDLAQTFPTGVTAADQATLVGPDGKPLPEPVVKKLSGAIQIAADKNSFSVSSSALLGKSNVSVRWDMRDGTACQQQLLGGGQVGTAGSPAAPSPAEADVFAECTAAGVNAAIQIRAARANQTDFTVILLTDLGVCYSNRHFSTEGDPLFVGYARTDGAVAAIEFDKCETASPIPKILIGGDIGAISTQAGRAPKFEVQWFTPIPQCFGKSIEFHLNKKGATKFAQATITQYERYRATLEVGAVYTDRHIESYGLKPQGNTNVLVSNGPEGNGPEYVAAVVIYGVPHYFGRKKVVDPAFVPGAQTAMPRRDPYFGREPVHENGLADRIGLLIGVGMSQPGRRFVIGGSFEVVTGLNVFVVNESVRLTVLNGYSPGDVFTGTAAQIPLKDDWDNGWAAGVAFDARYAVALFGKK